MEGSVDEEAADAVVVTMDGVMAVGVVVVVEVMVVTVLAVTVAMGVAGVVVVGFTVTVGTPPLHSVAAVVDGGVTATTGRTWFTRPVHKQQRNIHCLPSLTASTTRQMLPQILAMKTQINNKVCCCAWQDLF